MGVNQLWTILQPATSVQPLEAIVNQRVVVDLSCWIVECSGSRIPGVHYRFQPHLHLAGLFHRLRTLLALNCTAACIADGDFDPLKRATVTARLQGPLSQQQQDKANAVRYAGGAASKRPQHSHFGRMVQEGARLCKAMGIPCIRSPLDAEAQCAVLNAAGLFDACITSDSDAFLFGATKVYRSLKLDSQSGCEGVLEVCTLQAIKSKLGFARNSLIALGVFLGSDYHDGVKGIGVQKASKLVAQLGERHVLDTLLRDGVQTVLAESSSKRKPKKGLTAVENEGEKALCDDKAIAAVIATFLDPVVHPPTSDAVTSALNGSHEVDLESLVGLMQQYLDWEEDKTKSFILPKLAERCLRQRAAHVAKGLPNSTLSAGTCLQYIPREIVKARTAKHVRCFEVSWQGSPPLGDTTVPAALLERSYPELVRRYQEAEATKKLSKKKAPQSRSKAGLKTCAPLCPTEARAMEPLCENLEAVDLRIDELEVSRSSSCWERRRDEMTEPVLQSPRLEEDAHTDDEFELRTSLSERLSRAKDVGGLAGRRTMPEESTAGALRSKSFHSEVCTPRNDVVASKNGRQKEWLQRTEKAASEHNRNGGEVRSERNCSYSITTLICLDSDDECETSKANKSEEISTYGNRSSKGLRKEDPSVCQTEKLRPCHEEKVKPARPSVLVAKQTNAPRSTEGYSRSPLRQARQERTPFVKSPHSSPPSSPETAGGSSIHSIMASIKLAPHRPAPTLTMGI